MKRANFSVPWTHYGVRVFLGKNPSFERLLRGWGETEWSEVGGGGGKVPSGLATNRTTRSWVAFSVATASSCVTFSKFLSPYFQRHKKEDDEIKKKKDWTEKNTQTLGERIFQWAKFILSLNSRFSRIYRNFLLFKSFNWHRNWKKKNIFKPSLFWTYLRG